MNKQELITSMAEKSQLTKKDVEVALKSFIEVVEETLVKGEKISLVGFGTFETREKGASTRKYTFGANKGQEYTTEAKTVPVFKSGKKLKDAVK